MSKTLTNDLLYLYNLEADDQVHFYAKYPIIRKKHGYLISEFQNLYIAFRNEKARGTL